MLELSWDTRSRNLGCQPSARRTQNLYLDLRSNVCKSKFARAVPVRRAKAPAVSPLESRARHSSTLHDDPLSPSLMLDCAMASIKLSDIRCATRSKNSLRCRAMHKTRSSRSVKWRSLDAHAHKKVPSRAANTETSSPVPLPPLPLAHCAQCREITTSS